MTTIYQWRIYCNVEATFKFVWSETAPTTCPTDTGHSVNPLSVSEVGVLSDESIQIKDIIYPPGPVTLLSGRYRAKTHAFDALASTTTTSTFSLPYPIALLSGKLITDATANGDIVSMDAGANTTLGAITASLIATDTVIPLSGVTLALPQLIIGAFVRLTDGTNTTPYLIVIAKSSTDITVSAPVGYIFSHLTPTYLQIKVVIADEIELAGDGIYTFGTRTVAKSYIPANTNLRVIYNNTHGTDRRVSVFYEYYY